MSEEDSGRNKAEGTGMAEIVQKGRISGQLCLDTSGLSVRGFSAYAPPVSTQQERREREGVCVGRGGGLKTGRVREETEGGERDGGGGGGRQSEREGAAETQEGGGVKERERDSQTDRPRQRDRQTATERDRGRETETKTETEKFFFVFLFFRFWGLFLCYQSLGGERLTTYHKRRTVGNPTALRP